MTRALLVVDVQVDFCEGGSLAVAGGREVAQRISHLLNERPGLYTSVFASRDWHEPLPSLNGGHFAEPGTDPDYVTTWPVHCVARTPGAGYHPDLELPAGTIDVIKGMGRPDYSAFQGVGDFPVRAMGKPLAFLLGQEQVTSLDIVGIATDHCVHASTVGALRLLALREVRVITDLCAGVNPGASERALTELKQDGAVLTTTSYL